MKSLQKFCLFVITLAYVNIIVASMLVSISVITLSFFLFDIIGALCVLIIITIIFTEVD